MDTFQPFDEVDLTKWRKIFEVNVWGALGLTQACIPHLKKAATDHGDASPSAVRPGQPPCGCGAEGQRELSGELAIGDPADAVSAE